MKDEMNLPVDPTDDNEWNHHVFKNAIRHVVENLHIAQLVLKEYTPNENQMKKICDSMDKLKGEVELTCWVAQAKHSLNKN